MAGSIAEAMSQINSLNPGELARLSTRVRDAGARSAAAGGTLRSSATEVGAQYGEPYAAYQDRLAPVATWLTRFEEPATTAATSLQNASVVATSVQEQASRVIASLASYGVSQTGPNAAANMEQAQDQALAMLNELIAQMTAAYDGVAPPSAGTAPVKAGGGGAAGNGAAAARTGAAGTAAGGVGAAGTAAGGVGAAAADGSAPDAAGVDAAGVGAAGLDAPGVDAAGLDAAGLGAVGPGSGGIGVAPADRLGANGVVGPSAGPFSGWVRDPLTGNLIDPGTGREVNAGGRFLDPVTGLPFGDAAPYASRLEGLQGGVTTTAGLLGGVTPAASLGGVVGGSGLSGGSGSGSGLAGLYGGMVPPSMLGTNPAAGQLRDKAVTNLDARAAFAQRYVALSSGQEHQTGAYLPPMGGAGMGAGGAGRSGGRTGRRMVSEPAAVWGATGRGDRAGRTRAGTGGGGIVEDEDVWTGGDAPDGAGLLGR